jgi:hypothetical protein
MGKLEIAEECPEMDVSQCSEANLEIREKLEMGTLTIPVNAEHNTGGID